MSNSNEPIRDAKQLGTGKVLVLGLQHMFAMFGATVLVPIITGLSVSATLLFAGLATLFMHLITGKKVPVFLGSSFAFLGGYAAVVAAEDLPLLQLFCILLASVFLLVQQLFKVGRYLN